MTEEIDVELTYGEALQVFDGVLLSDGCLYLEHKHGLHRSVNYQFKISQSGHSHADWLWFIRDALLVLGVVCRPPKLYHSTSHGKPYSYIHLRSNVSPWLTEQYGRWYPDGVKIVPEDFEFAPISLANEFMGDGSSAWNNSNPENGVTLSLCTHGFDPESIGRLQRQLELIGITHNRRVDHSKAKGSKRDFAVLLKILGTDTELFLDIIEPYILPSFRYKVKREGSKLRYGSRR